jgi:hypothetical protein
VSSQSYARPSGPQVLTVSSQERLQIDYRFVYAVVNLMMYLESLSLVKNLTVCRMLSVLSNVHRLVTAFTITQSGYLKEKMSTLTSIAGERIPQIRFAGKPFGTECIFWYSDRGEYREQLL